MRKEEVAIVFACVCTCVVVGGDLCVSVEEEVCSWQAVCNSATEFVFLYVKEQVLYLCTDSRCCISISITLSAH